MRTSRVRHIVQISVGVMVIALVLFWMTGRSRNSRRPLLSIMSAESHRSHLATDQAGGGFRPSESLWIAKIGQLEEGRRGSREAWCPRLRLGIPIPRRSLAPWQE